jgi:hypothetical protein
MNQNEHEGTAARTESASNQDTVSAERRRFLLACGKFAAITPPTMTLLLTSGSGFAVAASGSGGSGSSGGGGGDVTYYTYFVPRDDALIQANGGVKPGDTICFVGGCRSVTVPPS